MKPDIHEWLLAERARVKAEGTGSTFVRNALAEQAKRILGSWMILVPAVYLINILPRRADGSTQAVPLFALGVALVGIGLLVWKQKKFLGPASRWATWTAFGLGILFCLVAPLH